jgi:hypothetical protein
VFSNFLSVIQSATGKLKAKPIINKPVWNYSTRDIDNYTSTKGADEAALLYNANGKSVTLRKRRREVWLISNLS